MNTLGCGFMRLGIHAHPLLVLILRLIIIIIIVHLRMQPGGYGAVIYIL